MCSLMGTIVEPENSEWYYPRLGKQSLSAQVLWKMSVSIYPYIYLRTVFKLPLFMK